MELLRRFWIVLVQLYCYIMYNHEGWSGSEFALPNAISIRKNPYLEICVRCGATAVRET